MLVFVALMWPLRHGFTDDGFIHIQYARNIATSGEYSFNPGHVSFGTTSPLWVIVLAAIGRVFGAGEGLIVWSRVLSWAAGIGSLWAMRVLAGRLRLDTWATSLAVIALAAHAWHVRWTALSMETSSSVLAVIAVAIAALGAHEDSRRAWLLGVCMALASLIRPEAYLLVPVYGVAFALTPGRRWGCLARTLIAFAALVLPWLVFAKVHIGHFLPNTAGAKSGGFDVHPAALAARFQPIAKIVGASEGLFVIAIVVALFTRRFRSVLVDGGRLFLLLWVVALPVAYAVLDIQVLSRYLLLTSPITIVLGFVALQSLFDREGAFSFDGRRVTVAVTTLTVCFNMVLYFGVVLKPSREFSYDLTHRLKSLALFIHDNSDDDAVVAAADIGYLAFYSRRYVLDLGGLVDDVTSRLCQSHPYEEIVEEGLFLDLPEYPRVAYFIDRELLPNRFDGRTVKGYRFESLRVDEIRNLGIRKPGPIFYTLYRLRRDDDA